MSNVPWRWLRRLQFVSKKLSSPQIRFFTNKMVILLNTLKILQNKLYKKLCNAYIVKNVTHEVEVEVCNGTSVVNLNEVNKTYNVSLHTLIYIRP